MSASGTSTSLPLKAAAAEAKSGGAHAVPQPTPGAVLLNPVAITREGLNFVGHEGLLFVPEDRAIPESRVIGIHFFHFPAQEKTDLPPVFYLPGGPGGSYGKNHFYEYFGGERALAWTFELRALNQKRDLLIVNQRGNYHAPGLQPELRWKWKPSPLDVPMTKERTERLMVETVKNGVEHWQEKGVALSGYDILNITDDLEDLRKVYGYETIGLRGTSFGSQWALAYMKRWPSRVDRALLGGVEPLDHTYDSPVGLFNALERLEGRALSQAKVKESLPPGLMKRGLLQSLLDKAVELDRAPVTVEVSAEDDEPGSVTLGGSAIRSFATGAGIGSRRENLEAWPKFVSEIVAGDLRLIASSELESRPDIWGGPMIGLLIDSSLGISSERRALLEEEGRETGLGEINQFYTATRGVVPTREVTDEFRAATRTRIPVLMIQGDLDFSTPIENSHELLSTLDQGHLLTVKGGTHSAIRELIQNQPDLARDCLGFFEADFATSSPEKFFTSLPTEVELPPLDFLVGGERLYEVFED